MDINELLKRAVELGASDLHLKVAAPPVFRIDGRIQPQRELPACSLADLEAVLARVANEEQRRAFAQDRELDCAYSVPGLARFRVNVLQQRGTMGFAFRQVPFKIPSIDELKLPAICRDLPLKPRGLVLVTGPTGSGKSTTMAAMLDYLNKTAAKSVITIEDPIEFLYKDDQCLISQRDLGDDTRSFGAALVHALRHDPDVIAVGEMRDLQTVGTALMAAETGHLVLGTLHTTDAPQTIDRIIDIFPASQQRQVRLQLAQVLEGVLTQTLLPRLDGKGRVAAFEILVPTTAVRNLIREERLHELHGVMQVGSKDGMVTLDQSLLDLVRRKVVAVDEALSASSNPKRLKTQIDAGGPGLR
jgi:twitching motility protein PilT